MKFAKRADGHRRHLFIENVGGVIRHGAADGHGLLRITVARGGDDGGLGRAVGVDHAAAGARPARDEIGGALFAAEDENPQRRHVLGHHREQRGHARKHGDARLGEQARQRGAGLDHFARADDERRARVKREPHFLDRRVERDREALIHAVRGAHLKQAALGADEIARAAVLELHALGAARGAGGVNDVRQILGRRGGVGGREARGGFRAKFVGLLIERERGAGQARAFRRKRGRGDHRACLAIGENVGDAIRGIIGIERHVGRAGFEHREQRHTNIERAREEEGDALAALRAVAAEMTRELVGSVFQLAVGHAFVAAHQRDFTGKQIGGGLEQFVQQFAPRECGIKRRPGELGENALALVGRGGVGLGR